MSSTILRDYFQDGQGIRREVISADIQSFLGRDATVRPGRHVEKGVEIKGYWIKAYRNLTTSMIEDLKEKSARWEQETKKSGRRGNYEDSRTFQETGPTHKKGNSSPRVDLSHQPASRHVPGPDMMDYVETRPEIRQDPYARSHTVPVTAASPAYADQPIYAPPGRQPPPGYMQQGERWIPVPGFSGEVSHPSRGNPPYPPGYPGQYGQPPRDARDDPRYSGGREDQMRYPGGEDLRYPHGREDPRYPRDDPRYHHHHVEEPRYQPSREDMHRYHQPQREDPRYQQIAREDPRYGQAGYQDASSRYAYPSPSTSTGSMPGHEQVSSPPVPPARSGLASNDFGTVLTHSSYAQPGQYDQGFGRQYPPQPPSMLEQPFQPPPGRMDPPYNGASVRKRPATEGEPRHGRNVR